MMNASDPQAAWWAARRILAVRLDNLGDVLLATPAIHAIRQSLPSATITLLASPVGAQAGRLDPDIDEVIEYQAPWMDPWCTLPQDPERELQIVERLREGSFDVAIIFTSFRQSPLPSAYLCYMAGIPLRLAASIDGPGSLLTTRHQHPDRMMHEVERGLDLVAAAGFVTGDTDLVLRVPEEARERLRAMLPLILRGCTGPLVVVHPGCSMPARTYSWERYADVCNEAVRQLGATVVLTGAESEREMVARIATRAERDPICLAGELSFPLFCALIEAAHAVITNNTGPMHIASALKTPVVALFALTNPPEQWAPWHVPHRQLYREVPCRLCYSKICPRGHECLAVGAGVVVAAAADLLDVATLAPAGAAR
jgi:ADP-heptose:LPS heptosyltransferase